MRVWAWETCGTIQLIFMSPSFDVVEFWAGFSPACAPGQEICFTFQRENPRKHVQVSDFFFFFYILLNLDYYIAKLFSVSFALRYFIGGNCLQWVLTMLRVWYRLKVDMRFLFKKCFISCYLWKTSDRRPMHYNTFCTLSFGKSKRFWSVLR